MLGMQLRMDMDLAFLFWDGERRGRNHILNPKTIQQNKSVRVIPEAALLPQGLSSKPMHLRQALVSTFHQVRRSTCHQFLLQRDAQHSSSSRTPRVEEVTMVCYHQEPYRAQDDVSPLHLLPLYRLKELLPRVTEPHQHPSQQGWLC